MYIRTLEGCCSIIEIENLYKITQSEFKKELCDFLAEDYFLTEKEYPTCIIATTNNDEQPEAIKVLKELKFKEIPFYGRHQESNLKTTGKKRKYCSLWIRTSLPKGIITKAKRIQRDYRKY